VNEDAKDEFSGDLQKLRSRNTMPRGRERYASTLIMMEAASAAMLVPPQ
jgi:hypothetical protein